MPDCPHCGTSDTRVVWNRANLFRVLGSVVLVPFYFLGGMAGDTRGPLLPLERRCPVCGRVFKERSVVDEVRSHHGG